jgi:hypothetical protein
VCASSSRRWPGGRSGGTGAPRGASAGRPEGKRGGRRNGAQAVSRGQQGEDGLSEMDQKELGRLGISPPLTTSGSSEDEPAGASDGRAGRSGRGGGCAVRSGRRASRGEAGGRCNPGRGSGAAGSRWRARVGVGSAGSCPLAAASQRPEDNRVRLRSGPLRQDSVAQDIRGRPCGVAAPQPAPWGWPTMPRFGRNHPAMTSAAPRPLHNGI